MTTRRAGATTTNPRPVLGVWRVAAWRQARELVRSAQALFEAGHYAPASFMAVSAIEEVGRALLVWSAEEEHRAGRPTAPTLAEVRRLTTRASSRQLRAITESFLLHPHCPAGEPRLVGALLAKWWKQSLDRAHAGMLSVRLASGLSVPSQAWTRADAAAAIAIALGALVEQAQHCLGESAEGLAQVETELDEFIILAHEAEAGREPNGK